jgi:putative sigma-54 modulation protein
MQINLDGHHVEITPSLREYVSTKFSKVEKHVDKITDIHVVLTVEKQNQKAEATIQIAGGSLHADATDENMYAAIDSLADKIDRQAKKHKEKQSAHRG